MFEGRNSFILFFVFDLVSELKLNVQYVFKFYLSPVDNKYLIVKIRVKHTQFCFVSFWIL